MAEHRCTPPCWHMLRYLVEPVVGLYAFSVFMTFPLLQQYVYRRLWVHLSGAPYPTNLSNTHCNESATNLTSIHTEVQREASLFILKTELCFLFPSLLSAPLLVSYSDYRGRKAAIVPPLVGDLIFSTTYFVVSAFSLSMKYLLGAAFISGFLGGPTTLIGGCFAYVADRSEQGHGISILRRMCGTRSRREGVYRDIGDDRSHENMGDISAVAQCEDSRTGGVEVGCESNRENVCNTIGDGNTQGLMVRIAGLDTILGLLSGLASLCTGFFIRTAGFTWPFLTASLLHLLNLAYVICVLKESLNPPEQSLSSTSSLASPTSGLITKVRRFCPPMKEMLFGQLQGVYLLFASGSRKRNRVLGLLLAAFAIYKMAKLGGMSIFILYELNKPLCWSEVLVGYGSALTAAFYVVSFAAVALLSRCLRDLYIILLGLLSLSAGLLMAAFAKTTLLMFLVRVPLVLSIMPSPVFRSMMSKAVLSSEQGAVFACIAFVEMLSVGVALTVFNSTYAATVSWFSGFSFLLASSLTIIPAVLTGVLLYLPLGVEEDMAKLTAEEEEPDKCSNKEMLQISHRERQHHSTQ